MVLRARYVTKGYNQIEVIDYQETLAPTANLTSVRVLMQVAVCVHQMDLKAAY